MLGITTVTSFGVWINADYLGKYSHEHVNIIPEEYGQTLADFIGMHQ